MDAKRRNRSQTILAGMAKLDIRPRVPVKNGVRFSEILGKAGMQEAAGQGAVAGMVDGSIFLAHPTSIVDRRTVPVRIDVVGQRAALAVLPASRAG